MKIRKSSRITALFLALVMILPLISIPTFAEEVTATPFFTQNFNSGAVADVVATDSTTTTIADAVKKTDDKALNIVSKLLDVKENVYYYNIGGGNNDYKAIGEDYTVIEGGIELKNKLSISTTITVAEGKTVTANVDYTVSGAVNDQTVKTAATLTPVGTYTYDNGTADDTTDDSTITLTSENCAPAKKVYICNSQVQQARQGGNGIAGCALHN